MSGTGTLSPALVGDQRRAAYEPPYEGALQDEFAWQLVKYLREDARLEAEVSVEAPGALFKLDFLLTTDGRRVAVECTHAMKRPGMEAEARRDTALLATGQVDAVYRFTGSNVLYGMDDVLYVLSCYEPGLFSERGRINLRSLATAEAREAGPLPHGCRLDYAEPEDEPGFLAFRRTANDSPALPPTRRNADVELAFTNGAPGA